ncbi:MAG: hypothetical protein H0W30_16755 [Gemmatimonadaceae bacterium]|nr:hypothetical protein [Gemmatimonadaceae bacterium]
MFDAAAALLVLLVATTLSVYKPRGMSPYGRRKQREESNTVDDPGLRPIRGPTPGAPRWVRVFGTIILVLAVLFVIKHLTGGGLGNHGTR